MPFLDGKSLCAPLSTRMLQQIEQVINDNFQKCIQVVHAQNEKARSESLQKLPNLWEEPLIKELHANLLFFQNNNLIENADKYCKRLKDLVQ